MIAWKRPFRVLELNSRIYIIDAEQKRLTEVTPGQFAGYVPTRADQREIADWLVNGLNFDSSDRWADCSEQSPTAIGGAVG